MIAIELRLRSARLRGLDSSLQLVVEPGRFARQSCLPVRPAPGPLSRGDRPRRRLSMPDEIHAPPLSETQWNGGIQRSRCTGGVQELTQGCSGLGGSGNRLPAPAPARPSCDRCRDCARSRAWEHAPRRASDDSRPNATCESPQILRMPELGPPATSPGSPTLGRERFSGSGPPEELAMRSVLVDRLLHPQVGGGEEAPALRRLTAP